MGKKEEGVVVGELSHVKINWNRMVVSAGWWLVSAGGTRGVPPSLGPGAAAYPPAPLPGRGKARRKSTVIHARSHQ